MSEEKLYAVKNDEGNYWAFGVLGGFWRLNRSFTGSEDTAKNTVKEHGGNVVTFVEEPKKVALTKEQAEIVEWAHDFDFPASHISNNYCEYEELLMKAYVNGYTVEKEKKYNVKVPLVQAQGGLWFYINSDDKLDATYIQWLAKKFTMDEIEENGLQDCEKEEVTDDDD